ncbi:MAG: adenylate kinase [Elusimicrobiota bacterium]|jgi:adenylate kinase|nr:adenylate kinase [Elusimicrobiota bacterium]
MNVILLGSPGAGKGSQAVRLKDEFGFRHISTGDLIRAEIAAATPLGKKVESLVKQGNLVADDLIFDLLKNALKSETRSIVFDGFPRTIAQAEDLDKYLAEQGKKMDYILSIELTDEEAIKRLTSRRVCKSCGAVYNIYWPDYKGVCTKCGGELYTRADDTLESAKHRLDVFKKETQPLLDYYGSKPGFVKINGLGALEEVFASIKQALNLIK